MNRSFVMRVAACAALVAFASACNDETATVLSPLNRKAYNFLLVKEGANVPRMSGGVVSISRTTAATTSTIADITIQGLEVLQGTAGYVLWIASLEPAAAGSADSIITNVSRLRTSSFRAIRVDTTINAEGDFVPTSTTVVSQTTAAVAPTFNAGGQGTRYEISTTAAALGFQPHLRHFIFVTVVADTANPGTPAPDGSDARLWLRYTATLPAVPTGSATTTATRTPTAGFGNGNAAAAKEYRFIASGRGRGSLLSDRNVLILDDSLLARPPKGYYYESWLIARADNVNFFARDSLSLGPQTAPYPRRDVSLYSADSLRVDPVIQEFPALIYAEASRVQGDSLAGLSTSTSNRFRGIANAFVTLEHKLGTPAMSPAIILAGTTPPPIRSRD